MSPQRIILQNGPTIYYQERSLAVNMERAQNGSYYNNDQLRPRTCSRVIEATRDDDDRCYMSRLHWVLFMTIQHCVFELHYAEAMYFMTRIQYLLVNSDFGDGISMRRFCQIDLESLLERGFGKNARFSNTLEFLAAIASYETDPQVLGIFRKPTVWKTFLELSVAELGDEFRLAHWREITSRMRRAIMLAECQL